MKLRLARLEQVEKDKERIGTLQLAKIAQVENEKVMGNTLTKLMQGKQKLSLVHVRVIKIMERNREDLGYKKKYSQTLKLHL